MDHIETWKWLFWCALFSLFLFTCEGSASFKVPAICKSSCEMKMEFTKTADFCNENTGLEIQHRCCVNKSASIVLGIDLQDCNLTRRDFSAGIQNLSALVIISLQGNPLTKLEKDDFHQNIAIQYMSLPANLTCPGGSKVWGGENMSSSATVCTDELNPCTVYNVTCPDYSHCVHVGVNMTNCLCDDGYHGYKCLKLGNFPFMQYGLGLSIPTVLVCLFLWVTQRRYVKSKPKDT